MDPGGVEAGFLGNHTWTRKRNAHQAAFEALPLGCAGTLPTSPIPVPQYALQGTYRTANNQPATALLLRFANAVSAAAYRTGYQARMTACGSGGNLAVDRLWSTTTAAASLPRYAGGEPYIDVPLANGSTVALLAAAVPAVENPSAWAHSVVPALEAVI